MNEYEEYEYEEYDHNVGFWLAESVLHVILASDWSSVITRHYTGFWLAPQSREKTQIGSSHKNVELEWSGNN